MNEIPFDAYAFINAINDAIEKAYNKKDIGKTLKQAEKEQKKEYESKIKKKVSEIKKEKSIKENYGTKEELIDIIKDFYLTTEDETKKRSIKDEVKSLGLGKFDELIDCDYESLIPLYELTK